MDNIDITNTFRVLSISFFVSALSYTNACTTEMNSHTLDTSILKLYNSGLEYYKEDSPNQDYDKAFKFFKAAAVKGDAKAQYKLGNMYQYGQSVEQDIETAIEWYKKAATQGLAEAHNQLGLIHSNDIYDKKNYD